MERSPIRAPFMMCEKCQIFVQRDLGAIINIPGFVYEEGTLSFSFLTLSVSGLIPRLCSARWQASKLADLRLLRHRSQEKFWIHAV